MSITGLNWQDGKKRSSCSYYFSHYPGIWGWASWKSSWSKYLFRFNSNSQENTFIDVISNSKREALVHKRDMTNIERVDTWDYSWRFTIMYHKGYCVIPKTNLVSNIGWGDNATHTRNKGNWKARRATNSISFPLQHPDAIHRNIKADRYTARMIFLDRESQLMYYLNNSIGLIRKWLGLL
jgi:hypothetical protein